MCLWGLQRDDLDEKVQQPLSVRDYFGEKVAIYFAFLGEAAAALGCRWADRSLAYPSCRPPGHYTTSLILPAFFGLIVFVSRMDNEDDYSVRAATPPPARPPCPPHSVRRPLDDNAAHALRPLHRHVGHRALKGGDSSILLALDMLTPLSPPFLGVPRFTGHAGAVEATGELPLHEVGHGRCARLARLINPPFALTPALLGARADYEETEQLRPEFKGQWKPSPITGRVEKSDSAWN